MVIPEGFLPFGSVYGDLAIRGIDDGSSGEIQVGADVVIFGSRNSSLYVSLILTQLCL